MGRGAGAANAGAANAGVAHLSCFWCGAKGHTIMDCTGPAPNPAAKLARDEMIAKRDKADRNAESTYAAIQALFQQKDLDKE